jgi:hypothetical protein
VGAVTARRVTGLRAPCCLLTQRMGGGQIDTAGGIFRHGYHLRWTLAAQGHVTGWPACGPAGVG